MNLDIKGLDGASRVVVETLEVRVLADRSHAARRPLRLSCPQKFLAAFLFFLHFNAFFYYVSSLLARCRKTTGTLQYTSNVHDV